MGGLYSTSRYSLLITFSSIIIPAAAVSKSKSIGLLDLVLERVIPSVLAGVKICVSLKVPLYVVLVAAAGVSGCKAFVRPKSTLVLLSVMTCCFFETTIGVAEDIEFGIDDPNSGGIWMSETCDDCSEYSSLGFPSCVE